MAKKEVKKTETTEQLLTSLIGSISGKMTELTSEFDNCLKNASAARRARKLTNELAKQFKIFRAVSVDHFKK